MADLAAIGVEVTALSAGAAGFAMDVGTRIGAWGFAVVAHAVAVRHGRAVGRGNGADAP